jgi:CRP-like cAMP-binding protein
LHTLPTDTGMPAYVQAISRWPLFRDLDCERLAIVDDLHGPQRRAERDSQLIHVRDHLRSPILTISTGWALRYSMLPDGRRQVLSFVLPGDTIGLDTLLTSGPVYPLQAATTVVYRLISHERAHNLLCDASWFRERAIQALACERAAAELALTRMGQCKAEEAVASVLLDLYNRLAERGLAAANQILVPLTQQQLADFVGMTAVHLNRTLGRLRSRGLVSISGRRLLVLNVSELERLAVLDMYKR